MKSEGLLCSRSFLNSTLSLLSFILLSFILLTFFLLLTLSSRSSSGISSRSSSRSSSGISSLLLSKNCIAGGNSEQGGGEQ